MIYVMINIHSNNQDKITRCNIGLFIDQRSDYLTELYIVSQYKPVVNYTWLLLQVDWSEDLLSTSSLIKYMYNYIVNICLMDTYWVIVITDRNIEIVCMTKLGRVWLSIIDIKGQLLYSRFVLGKYSPVFIKNWIP